MTSMEAAYNLLFIEYAEKKLNSSLDIPTDLDSVELLKAFKTRIEECDSNNLRCLYLFHMLYGFDINSHIYKFGLQKIKQFVNQDAALFKPYVGLFFEGFITGFLIESIDTLKLPENFPHLKRFCLVTNSLFTMKILELSETKSYDTLLVLLLKINDDIDSDLKEKFKSTVTLLDLVESTRMYKMTSEQFTSFSTCLHAQYKLISNILLNFLVNPSCQTSEFLLLKLQFFSLGVIAQLEATTTPLGVIMEGSIILSRLFVIERMHTNFPGLGEDFNEKLENFFYKNFQGARLSIPLLTAFLMDYSIYSKRFNISLSIELLSNLMRYVYKQFEIKPETRFVYLCANMFFVITNHLLSRIDQVKTELLEILASPLEIIQKNGICRIIQFTHSFCFSYWNMWAIPQIYDAFKGIVRVTKAIFKPANFESHTLGTLEPYFEIENPLYIHRIYLIMHEILDEETFEKLFGNLIRKSSIQQLIESFILGSNLSYLEISTDFHDDFDESDQLDENMMTLYQSTNRHNDFVLLFNIRLGMLAASNQLDVLNTEMSEFLLEKTAIAELCRKFFFNRMLPKLLLIYKKDRNNGQILALLLDNIASKYLPSNKSTISFRNYVNILRVVPKFSAMGISIPSVDTTATRKYVIDVATQNFDVDLKLEVLDIFLEKFFKVSKDLTVFWKNIYHIVQYIDQRPMLDKFEEIIQRFFTMFIDEGDALLKPAQQNDFYKDMEQFFEYICVIPECREDTTSLEVLVHLKTIEIFLKYIVQKDKCPLLQPCRVFFKQVYVVQIEPLLHHSCEEVRGIAMSFSFTVIEHEIITRKEALAYRKIWEKSFYSDLSIINPSQASHGCILLRLFLKTSRPFENQNDFMLETLNKLLAELETRVQSIQKNEINTLKHPTLVVMCAVRTLVLSEFVGKDELDQQLVDRILRLCLLAGTTILPVVCDESPEGYIPKAEVEKCDNASDLNMISQKYLLNSWMTLRDSLLLMVGLFNSLQSPSQNPNKNISCEQASKIYDFMFHNQLNLVHRGAFELSSTILSSFLNSFHTKHRDCKDCSTKTVKFFQNTMKEMFSKPENGDEIVRKEKITRRSAGFPGFIQAVFGVHQEGFASVIENLIALLESDAPKYHWQVILKFNVFRFLIQDPKFTDLLENVLERVLVVCLKWFNYEPEWLAIKGNYQFPIRNACTTLFSALITKIFGVKRNRQDNSPKNRMPSQLLFQKFPKLYSLLLDILVMKKTNAFLLPALQILSRINPSLTLNHTFDLQKFLKPLRDIVFDSNDLNHRETAAKVYSQLLQVEDFQDSVEEFYQGLLTLPFPSALLLNEIIVQFMKVIETQQSSRYEISRVFDRMKDIFEYVDLCFIDYTDLKTTSTYMDSEMHLLQFRLFCCAKLNGVKLIDPCDLVDDFNFPTGTRPVARCFTMRIRDMVSNSFRPLGFEKAFVRHVMYYLAVHMFKSSANGETDKCSFASAFIILFSMNAPDFYEGRLLAITVLKEIMFLSINMVKKIYRVERDAEQQVFDNELAEMIHFVHKVFDRDLVSLDFFKGLFSHKFLTLLLENCSEYQLFIRNKTAELDNQLQLDILGEVYELIYYRFQANDIEALESKEVVKLEFDDTLTLFQIFKMSDDIDPKILEPLFSVVCIGIQGWTTDKMGSYVITDFIRIMYRHIESPEPTVRATVLRCLQHLLDEYVLNKGKFWHQRHRTAFYVTISLFEILLILFQDSEPGIVREAALYTNRLYQSSGIPDKMKNLPMIPIVPELALKFIIQLIGYMFTDYFKYLTKNPRDPKSREKIKLSTETVVSGEKYMATLYLIRMILKLRNRGSFRTFELSDNICEELSISRPPITEKKFMETYAAMLTPEDEKLFKSVFASFDACPDKDIINCFPNIVHSSTRPKN